MIVSSLITNHIWLSLSDALANLDIASPQCPFGLLEVWDENNKTFENNLRKITDFLNVDVNISPAMQNMGFELIGITSDDVQLSLNYIRNRIICLSKCGVKNITFSSPFTIKALPYENAVQILVNNLIYICNFCVGLGIEVGFEAFDITKDKCRLLGKTDDLIHVLHEIKDNCANFYLTWDSGHFALEGDNLFVSLSKLKDFIKRVHISNYSLCQDKWYYGDKHLPFGTFGDMSILKVKKLIAFIKKELINTVESLSFEVACYPQIVGYSTTDEVLKHIISMLSLLEDKNADNN